MWPVLFDGKFLTIVQVDKPQEPSGELPMWSIGVRDVSGNVHTALYRHVGTADAAYTAFRQFAVRASANRGLFIWPMDRDGFSVEIMEGEE